MHIGLVGEEEETSERAPTMTDRLFPGVHIPPAVEGDAEDELQVCAVMPPSSPSTRACLPRKTLLLVLVRVSVMGGATTHALRCVYVCVYVCVCVCDDSRVSGTTERGVLGGWGRTQTKITKYLELKAQGRSINTELRKSKGYRNPDFLQKIVEHFNIDEKRSHFAKDVFDPTAFPPEDYYDKISAFSPERPSFLRRGGGRNATRPCGVSMGRAGVHVEAEEGHRLREGRRGRRRGGFLTGTLTGLRPQWWRRHERWSRGRPAASASSYPAAPWAVAAPPPYRNVRPRTCVDAPCHKADDVED